MQSLLPRTSSIQNASFQTLSITMSFLRVSQYTGIVEVSYYLNNYKLVNYRSVEPMLLHGSASHRDCSSSTNHHLDSSTASGTPLSLLTLPSERGCRTIHGILIFSSITGWECWSQRETRKYAINVFMQLRNYNNTSNIVPRRQ